MSPCKLLFLTCLIIFNDIYFAVKRLLLGTIEQYQVNA